MKKRTLILHLFFVTLALLPASVGLADIVTDDFDDGVIDPMWMIDFYTPGVSVVEHDGYLDICGTITEPTPWSGGNVYNMLYGDSLPIEAQMKLKVASEAGYISLEIAGTNAIIRLEHYVGGGYGFVYVTPYSRQFISGIGPKGNEAVAYNLLKLLYDPATGAASAYLCDSDGSNPISIGSFTVSLIAPGVVNRKLSVRIQYGTAIDAAVNYQIDDFSVSAAPYPELEPPPVITGVSLGERRVFESDLGDITLPAYSHDGEKLAYLLREGSPEAGDWNIYMKDLTSDAPPELIESNERVSLGNCLSWSPNDRRIFFLSEPVDNRPKIRYVDITEEPKQSHVYRDDLGDAWFGGIDFSRNADHKAAYVRNGNLSVISVDDFGDPLPGAADIQLTGFTEMDYFVVWPRWSPDGSKITCGYSFNQHSSAIWSIDAAALAVGEIILDDSNPHVSVLTDTRNFASTPAFSFDGKYIYYCSDLNNCFNAGASKWDRYNPIELMTGNADFDLFITPADGSEPPQRLNDEPLNQGILSASPDGTHLAYNTDDDSDGDGIRDGDIVICSLISSNTITTSGGEVSDGSGTTVSVPADALPEGMTEVDITIETPLPGSEPPLDTLPPGTSLALAREFGPDDQVFVAPVKIEIRYTDEEVAGLDEANLQIYYYDDITGEWTALDSDPTCSDPDLNVICSWVTHFSMFAVLDVPTLMAAVELEPPSLNVKSKGQYVTAYIELPPGFHPSSVNVGQVRLNGTILALAAPTAVGDHDSDGIPDLMVKFDRASVQAALPLGWAPVTISGCLANGVYFEDTLSIYVFDKGMSHYNDMRPDSIE